MSNHTSHNTQLNDAWSSLHGKGGVVFRKRASSPVLLVCEHASYHIPADYNNLGIDQKVRQTHVAWDIGAFALAYALAEYMDAKLVASGISRLVYDCNRSFEQSTAIPEKSEIYTIAGNTNLSYACRHERFSRSYLPFASTIQQCIDKHITHLVSVHSFTPVFWGKQRKTHIGFIHDSDARWAQSLHALAASELAPYTVSSLPRPLLHTGNAQHTPWCIELNAPYSMKDKATHTIHRWGVQQNKHNVMIEVRNDLLHHTSHIDHIAAMLARWLCADISNNTEQI